MIKLLFSYVKKYKINLLFIYLLSISFPIFVFKFSNNISDMSSIFFIIWVVMLFGFIETSFTQEEKCNVIQFIAVMPIKRKYIVKAKYILILALSTTSLMLYFITSYIMGLAKSYIEYNWNAAVISFIIILVLCIFLFPLCYKFGYDKAQFILILSILVIFLVFCTVSVYSHINNLDLFSSIMLKLHEKRRLIKLFALAISLGLYYISSIRACYNFDKRDL